MAGGTAVLKGDGGNPALFEEQGFGGAGEKDGVGLRSGVLGDRAEGGWREPCGSEELAFGVLGGEWLHLEGDVVRFWGARGHHCNVRGWGKPCSAERG